MQMTLLSWGITQTMQAIQTRMVSLDPKDDWGNNAEGRIIPQPSYPLPGITSGFPVMDASSSSTGTHVPDGEAQPTDNDDLTNKIRACPH